MSCPDLHALSLLESGRFEGEDSAAREHVAGCAACRERLAKLSALLAVPPAEPPAHVLVALRARIEEQSARERRAPRPRPGPGRPGSGWVALVVGLAGTAALAGVLATRHEPFEPPPEVSTPTPAAPSLPSTASPRAPSPGAPEASPAPSPLESPAVQGEPPAEDVPGPAPAPAETASPASLAQASPAPVGPAPREPAPAASTPAPATTAALASSVEIVARAGTLTVGKRKLAPGETVRVRPEDELASSGTGARFEVGACEVRLRAGSAARLEERRREGGATLALVLAKGDALLSVAPAVGASPAAVEIGTAWFSARVEGSRRAQLLCSLAGDRTTLAALEGEARVGPASREPLVALATGKQVSAARGAAPASLRPERAGAAPAWAAPLGPRVVVLLRATFEEDESGFDMPEGCARVAGGFAGSGWALRAAPATPGSPQRFVALRTKFALDPARHALRFWVKTKKVDPTVSVSVTLAGASDSLQGDVKPTPPSRGAKDAGGWAQVQVRLQDLTHTSPGSGTRPEIGPGTDRQAHVALGLGTTFDREPADFLLDDFEILELD